MVISEFFLRKGNLHFLLFLGVLGNSFLNSDVENECSFFLDERKRCLRAKILKSFFWISFEVSLMIFSSVKFGEVAWRVSWMKVSI